MKENSNYIRVVKPSSDTTIRDFVRLMSVTEDILNKRSTYEKRPTPSELEVVVVNAIKEASNTVNCFKEDEIILVSGHKFPDIEVKPGFGVEVKMSSSGWSSIGSSIIESTRVPSIESIYIIFGNYSENPAQFKCKPYQDVLTDIKLTHSPRYLIDMNTSESIFRELGIEYSDFRKKSEAEKINIAQKYVREKFLKSDSKEMPWWIKNITDYQNDNGIRMWNSIGDEMKKVLTAKLMLLFPEIFSPSQGRNKKYSKPTLWLCSYYQIVFPNIRDQFSSGGKTKYGSHLIPAVYRHAKNLNSKIKEQLKGSDEDFEVQLSIYNNSLFVLPQSERYEGWLNQISQFHPDQPIVEYFHSNDRE